ncbi:MAG: hypothetical protein QOJ32_1409 [Frankiaceae bacterium]|nr:hypothetical protein [Frankiaceae bacterium]
MHAALQPFVERYWSVRWDRGGLPGFRSEVLTHPCVNLSVESGDRPRFGHAMPAVLVHGVGTRRFVVDLEGAGRVTAAKFRPGGFAALFGVVPNRDTVLPASLFGLPGPALLTKTLAVDDDVDRAAVLDQQLVPWAHEPAPEYLELLQLLAAMLADRGLVRVEQVAALGSRTTRGLQRLFATYLGIGPKAVLARYRLHDALDLLDRGEVDDLAGLAFELGWADQAHFSRDFRAAVGLTPSEYRH